jgi:hypothetical protein
MRDLSREFAAKEQCDVRLPSERLQFLAGLEAYGFAGRDADFLAGARISSDAGLTGTHVKYAEAAQLDPLTFAQGAFHGREDRLDRLLRFGPAHAGPVYYRIHNIKLNHNILLLFDGKLC